MQGIAVGIAVDGYAGQSQFTARSNDADGNFTSISNQNLLKRPFGYVIHQSLLHRRIKNVTVKKYSMSSILRDRKIRWVTHPKVSFLDEVMYTALEEILSEDY